MSTAALTLVPAARPAAGETKSVAPADIRPSWFSIAAAVLVIVSLAGAAWFAANGTGGGDGSDLPSTNFAMAPSLDGSTPVATPHTPVPTPGPEYACTVTPLTENEVMDTILNPHRGYERLGYPASRDSDGYYESHVGSTGSMATASLPEIPDDTQYDQIATSSSDFWNCLMTGSAYQVWAMMDPADVQFEVLSMFPVIRTENDLREYVRAWGPRRYSAQMVHVFMDLGGVDPVDAARVPDPDRTTAQLSDDGTRVIVRMNHLPQSQYASEGYAELSLRLMPNGQWIAIDVSLPLANG